MGDHGRGIGRKAAGRRSGERAAAVPDPVDRPGAAGHRFGPRLVCSECGIRWDVHQRDPQPCTAEIPHDPFGRRPVVTVAAPIPLSPPLAPRPVVVSLATEHERDGES